MGPGQQPADFGERRGGDVLGLHHEVRHGQARTGERGSVALDSSPDRARVPLPNGQRDAPVSELHEPLDRPADPCGVVDEHAVVLAGKFPVEDDGGHGQRLQGVGQPGAALVARRQDHTIHAAVREHRKGPNFAILVVRAIGQQRQVAHPQQFVLERAEHLGIERIGDVRQQAAQRAAEA